MRRSLSYNQPSVAQSAIAWEWVPTSNELLIIFSGKQPLGQPPVFNLHKGTRDWVVNKMYVRDRANTWYHGMHPGIGDGVDALAAYLQRRIDECGVRRTVMVGGSMGGYAAILFGCLTTTDHVVAFGPQTFIDRWNRLRIWDHRSIYEKKQLDRLPSAEPAYFDLRSVLAITPNRPTIDIHVGRGNRIDRHHARALQAFREVQCIYHPTNRHDISRILKRTGDLYPIIATALPCDRVS